MLDKLKIYKSPLFLVYGHIFNCIKLSENISEPLKLDITDVFEDNDYINARFNLSLLTIEIAYQLCSDEFESLTFNQMYALLGHEFSHYYYKDIISDFQIESRADKHCFQILSNLKIPPNSLYELHLRRYKLLTMNNKIITDDFYNRLQQAKRFAEIV